MISHLLPQKGEDQSCGGERRVLYTNDRGVAVGVPAKYGGSCQPKNANSGGVSNPKQFLSTAPSYSAKFG